MIYGPETFLTVGTGVDNRSRNVRSVQVRTKGVAHTDLVFAAVDFEDRDVLVSVNFVARRMLTLALQLTETLGLIRTQSKVTHSMSQRSESAFHVL